MGVEGGKGEGVETRGGLREEGRNCWRIEYGKGGRTEERKD